MDDSKKIPNSQDTQTGTRRRGDRQFSGVASGEEQWKRLGCLLQPLDDVVFADNATLRDPFTEYLQGFGISCSEVGSTHAQWS